MTCKREVVVDNPSPPPKLLTRRCRNRAVTDDLCRRHLASRNRAKKVHQS